MQYCLASIPVSQLSLESAFQYRYELNSESIEQGIRRFGFVTPLLLLEGSNQKFELVSGHRRLEAVKRLGWREVPAVSLPADAFQRKDLYALGLFLNAPGFYTDADRVVVVRQARNQFQMSWTDFEPLAPLVGLLSSERAWEEHERMGKLPKRVLEFLASGHLAFKVARKLLDFDLQAQAVFLEKVLPGCRWTVSEGEQVLEWLQDLSRKERKPISEWLDQNGLSDILRHKDLSDRERAKSFYGRIHTLRFPLLASRVEKFHEIKHQLGAPNEIALESSQPFEEEGLRLSLKICSPEELKRVAENLQKKEGLFKELFDLVK